MFSHCLYIWRKKLRTIPAAVLLLLLLPVTAAGISVDCARLPTVAEMLELKADTIAIRKIQSCLSAAGLYRGTLNGILGPATVAALSRRLTGSSAPAQTAVTAAVAAPPVTAAAGAAKGLPAIDCKNLPTGKEFSERDYDRESIKKIQRCLMETGDFPGPVRGVKGPVTMGALERYHRRRGAVPPAAGREPPSCSNLPTRETFLRAGFDGEKVKVVQGCLRAKGFYQGEIDGMKGQQTLAALDKAQNAAAAARGTGIDCNRLPAPKAFTAQKYSRKQVEAIQGCLWEKGFYTGPIDGRKGPLTVAALGRAQGGDGGSVPNLAADGSYMSYRLTGGDLEQLQTLGKIAEKLKELQEEEFDSHYELIGAVKNAVQEVTEKEDYLPLVLKQAEQVKNYRLNDPYFLGLGEAGIPETVVVSLRELQDREYKSKEELTKALTEKLKTVPGSTAFYQGLILTQVEDLAGYNLPADFFLKLDTMYVPEPVLKKLQELQDVEYPTRGLFANALEERILKPLAEQENLDAEAVKAYLELLLTVGEKERLFAKGKGIKWKGWSCGCYFDDLSGVSYGIYPFWEAKGKEEIDFSVLTRIGYFGLTFDDKGSLIDRLDWRVDRAAFIDKARQYRTKVDLIVYRREWRNWSQFVGQKRSSFIDRLTSSIADAVGERLDNTLLNRLRPYISLGSSGVPRMGNGVTLFFDGYPDEPAAKEFLLLFVKELKRKLIAADGDSYVNIMIPLHDLEKVALLGAEVNLFLVLMEEPTSLNKKHLRQNVEDMFKGELRREMLRKIVPVIASRGHEATPATARQLEDDLVYFEDNFGGVGLWPVPTSRDAGAAVLNRHLRSAFGPKGKQTLMQRIYSHASWLTGFVGPHRWGFRIFVDFLLTALIGYGLLAIWLFELREFFRARFWWFFAAGILAMLVQLSLFLSDPYWQTRMTGVLFVLLLLGIVMTVWGYVRRMKQADLP